MVIYIRSCMDLLVNVVKGSNGMGYMSRIKASVTSHNGIAKSNHEDNFYINGRFVYQHETDNVQVSVENKADKFIFSVSDSMDIRDKQKQVSISINKELKKYHKRPEYKESDLDAKVEQVSNIVSETGNLISSIYSDSDNLIYPSIACLLIDDNTASVISLGTCKAYIIRDGFIRQLTSDWEKTQRLLKLGIITSEQASDLASRYGIPTEDSISEIQKSDLIALKEGDIFVLATNGLTDMAEDEDINEAFQKYDDLEVAVNFLVKNTLKKGGEDNITVMAVKIEKINNTYINESVPTENIRKKPTFKKVCALILIKLIKKIKKFDIKRDYPSIIALVLAISIIFGGASLIRSFSGRGALNNNEKNSLTQDDDIDKTNLDDNTNNMKDNENNNNDNSSEDPSENSENAGEEAGVNAPVTYTIKKGDTLYTISEHFYGDGSKYDIIMEYNNITDPSKIQIGQVLKIPDVNQLP